MILSQKCNCCAHEEICSKKESYKEVCYRISNAVSCSEKDLIAVDVKCNHFATKHRKQDSITGGSVWE